MPAILGLMLPAWLMPVRSPFTSAMNTGTPIFAEVFGQGLQRDGLAGAGGAGDQAVAVGQGWAAFAGGGGVLGYQQGVGHDGSVFLGPDSVA
jgi:hypothetical protein